ASELPSARELRHGEPRGFDGVARARQSRRFVRCAGHTRKTPVGPLSPRRGAASTSSTVRVACPLMHQTILLLIVAMALRAALERYISGRPAQECRGNC